jgi:hypothetical protein
MTPSRSTSSTTDLRSYLTWRSRRRTPRPTYIPSTERNPPVEASIDSEELTTPEAEDEDREDANVNGDGEGAEAAVIDMTGEHADCVGEAGVEEGACES